MTNTLVTGAQGYVGRYVILALLAAGHNVTGIGRSKKCDDYFTHSFDFQGESKRAPVPASIREQLSSSHNYNYVRCDLLDPIAVDNLINKVHPALVIHLAGALRDETWQNLAHSNLIATLNIMTASSKLQHKPTFVLGSTGSVYGTQVDIPITESAFPVPVGSYAVSKYMAEMMAKDIAYNSAMPLIIARIFNILGPGLQPRHLTSYLVHRIAEIEKLESEQKISVGDLNTARDFIDVRDVAQFLASDFSGYEPITLINIAGGAEVEIKTIVDKLCCIARIPIALTLDPTRNRSGANRIFANVDKLTKAYTLRYTLQQSLEDMLDYARSTLV